MRYDTLLCGGSVMSWLLEGLVTLITGSMLIIFRVWLETKWKNK